METIKIEKGKVIPHPERKRRSKYPFEKMEAGDSFFLPNRTTFSKQHYENEYNVSLTVRAENGGIRVWRVK